MLVKRRASATVQLVELPSHAKKQHLGRLAARRPIFEGAPEFRFTANRFLRVAHCLFCAWPIACETAVFLNERAIWRVPLASEEARCTEPSNHDRFEEVILSRGFALTYPQPLRN